MGCFFIKSYESGMLKPEKFLTKLEGTMQQFLHEA